MKKRTFITLNTSEAERLRIQKMAEMSGHDNVASFIKAAIESYSVKKFDYIKQNLLKTEKAICKIIESLQENEELDETNTQLLNWARFCLESMIMLDYCVNDETNYVEVPEEMLDPYIENEPKIQYRFGFPEDSKIKELVEYLKTARL